MLVLLIITSFFPSFAQSINESTDTLNEKSEIHLKLKYSSDYIYLGRPANKKAPYLISMTGYFHRSGLFAMTSASYLTKKDENRIDSFIMSIGYDYNGKNYAYGVSLSGYLFNDLNYTTRPLLLTSLDALAGYDLNLFIFYLDFGITINESTDYFSGIQLVRSFYVIDDKIVLKPSLYLNASTRNYYNEYYIKNNYLLKSGKGKGSNPVSEHILIDEGGFNIKNYEAEFNLIYKFKIVRLFFVTTWTFPVNPATITTPEGTFKEDLNNGFFWTTGFQIIL